MAIPSVFADFLLSTDASYLNSTNDVLEAVTYNTFSWKRLLSGKNTKDILQGGDSIKSFIQLDDAETAHFYGIGDEESPAQPQTVTAWTVPWRFLRGSMTWDDETVKLNTSGLGRTARHKQYFSFKRQIEKACWIDKFKLMERALASTPVAGFDSTTTGTLPQPIYGYLISDEADTQPTGLTTVQGINPSTETNWRNQRVTIPTMDAAAVTSAMAEGLLQALGKLARKVRFDGLPSKPEFSDRSTMPARVSCSLAALVLVETSMRALQDSFVFIGRQDPTYNNPTILGVPVEWVDYLATAKIYHTAGSAAAGYETEYGGTSENLSGPRYYFENLKDMTPVFHEEMYMEKHPPLTPHRQPSRHTIYVDTYYNIVCHNRRTQGVATPAADFSNYLAA